MSNEKKTVLVVDDAPDNIHLLSGVLKADYKIKAATSGEKALTVANKAPHPDVILLDVVMPGMDGYQVCEKLRQGEETRRIPVILVSANCSEEEQQRGRDLGAVAFVGKPVDSSELHRLLRDILP